MPSILHTCSLAGVIVLGGLLAGCAGLKQSLQNQPCALDPAQPFDVVDVDLDVRLLWKDESDQPYLTLDQARAVVEAQGDHVIAATNAGIYEPGYVPTGLFIEDGVEHQPLNLDDGRGNFYLKPNGVFFITESDTARIVESSEFPAIEQSVRHAIQSGPLLLWDRQIHPAFTPGSENCRLRSGIGVADDGTVYLAISNGAVNFFDFAVFFRDVLGVRNALYLDGAVSELYAPALGRTAVGQERYAGILVVVDE